MKYVTIYFFFQQTLLGTELIFPDLSRHTHACIPAPVLNRLTLQTPVVTICTTRFNVLKFHFLPTVNMCFI